MIFRQWQQVLDGTKTQTRRIIRPDERCLDGRTVSKHWISRFTFMPPAGEALLRWTFYNPKWQVGRDYAVQPGRGKKAVGRIRITGIRRERLQDITNADGMAEGIHDTRWFGWCYGTRHCFSTAISAFRGLWNSINEKPGTRWEDDPKVWVLEFEVVDENTV